MFKTFLKTSTRPKTKISIVSGPEITDQSILLSSIQGDKEIRWWCWTEDVNWFSQNRHHHRRKNLCGLEEKEMKKRYFYDNPSISKDRHCCWSCRNVIVLRRRRRRWRLVSLEHFIYLSLVVGQFDHSWSSGNLESRTGRQWRNGHSRTATNWIKETIALVPWSHKRSLKRRSDRLTFACYLLWHL